ncbi:hypothetical protein VTI28DRAFT_10227 [Corynascus sepedonium]
MGGIPSLATQIARIQHLRNQKSVGSSRWVSGQQTLLVALKYNRVCQGRKQTPDRQPWLWPEHFQHDKHSSSRSVSIGDKPRDSLLPPLLTFGAKHQLSDPCSCHKFFLKRNRRQPARQRATGGDVRLTLDFCSCRVALRLSRQPGAALDRRPGWTDTVCVLNLPVPCRRAAAASTKQRDVQTQQMNGKHGLPAMILRTIITPSESLAIKPGSSLLPLTYHIQPSRS